MSISRGFRSDFPAGHTGALRRDGARTEATAAVAPMEISRHATPDTPGLSSRSHEATLDWFALAEQVGQFIDLDTSAHALGAMVRRRGVPAATNLLCLAFLYGPGRMPLRLIAERAGAVGIAHVSEPALLRRLHNASTWLEHLAETLISQQLDRNTAAVPDLHTAPGLRASPHARPAPQQSEPSLAERLQLLSGAGMQAQQTQARRVLQAAVAKKFILDFVPWPTDLFDDAQVHWLLCVRWTFVSSTLKEGPVTRVDSDPAPASSLERTRTMAHLIAACIPRDEHMNS